MCFMAALICMIAADEPLKVGDIRAVHTPAPDAVAPALPDERYLARFLAAVRSSRPDADTLLNKPGIRILPDGLPVKIVRLRNRPSDTRVIPCADVTIQGGPEDGRTIILPIAYLRPAGSKPGPKEIHLPRFEVVPDSTYVATPGEQRTTSPFGLGVFAAADLLSYEALRKSGEADDGAGIKDLLAQKRTTYVQSGTRILIIKRHENQFIDEGRPVVEARVLDGPDKGKAFWITEQFVAPLSLHMVRDKAHSQTNARRPRSRLPIQPPRRRR